MAFMFWCGAGAGTGALGGFLLGTRRCVQFCHGGNQPLDDLCMAVHSPFYVAYWVTMGTSAGLTTGLLVYGVFNWRTHYRLYKHLNGGK